MERLAALLILACVALPGQAEKLVISVGKQGQEQAQQLPGTGTTKSQVEAKYGPPQEQVPAIGHPPISRWVYDDFTVYFEYNHVVHSVFHHESVQASAD